MNHAVEEKVREYFSEMIVLKDPQRTEFFSNLSLPAYMRAWLVMKFSNMDGSIDYDGVNSYIKTYIPNGKDFEQFKFRMVNGETVHFLARIRVTVDIKNGNTVFELPDFGGIRAGAGGVVDKGVAEEWQNTFLRENECWGILSMIWAQDLSKRTAKGILRLVGYKRFCPYTVDLDYYREARTHFTTEEWVNVLISAADYNPDGYVDENGVPSMETKLYFLRRLLPFVEKRINLMELAPKGTGKSYVYEKISKRGWLVSSGTISRAALIYDNSKKLPGLLTRYDYVAFDESQSITFQPASEVQQALKDYMEFGEVKGFEAQVSASAGVVVLGNIAADKFDVHQNMTEEIHPICREAATLDRIHGFVEGWKIPRMQASMIARGWALNTEYFAEVMHALRDDLQYDTVVDQSICYDPASDQRDLTAIKRICCAFVKLLFPNARTKEDIPKDEFIKYCLEPAKEMRQIIRYQLGIIDPKEYNTPKKRCVPNVQYNDEG